MKEHEHPYWMAVHHEGSERSKAAKEVHKIATEHGGKYDAGSSMYMTPENAGERHYGFHDKSKIDEAAKKIRAKGHLIHGVDY